VPLLMAAIGYFTERTLIQRVFHSKDRHILTLLLTFGLAIITEDLFKLGYGPNPYKPESPIPGASELFGIMLPNYRVFLIVAGS
jgi:branched-chain amino acid transport system permease protein